MKYIFFILIFISASTRAQKSILDSLLLQNEILTGDKKAYNQIRISKYSINQDSALIFAQSALNLAQTDTTKIQSKNQIAWLFKNAGKIDEAKSLVKEAVDQANKLKYEIGLSDLFLTYGSIYSNISIYDSALYYQTKALEIFKKLNDLDGQASILNNMSILYQKTGEYTLSKNSLVKSLIIRENQNKQKEVGDIYLNLGNVYYYKGQLDSCIYAFILALEIYEKEKLPNFQSYALANLAYIYSEELNEAEKAKIYFQKIIKIENDLKSQNTIASAYDGLGTIYKNKRAYDSAIYFYEKCLEVALNSQNSQLASMAYTNLGLTQLEIGNLTEAGNYLIKCVSIKREINDKTGLLSALNGLASLERQKGEYKAASNYLDEVWQLSVDLNNKVEMRNILSSKIEITKLQEDFETTVDLYEDFIALKDTILNLDKLNTIEELKTKYETEKKEQQIALQNAQLSEQEADIARNQILLVASIIAIILLIALGLLQRNRLKKKQQLKLKEAELRAREAEINATISSQEKERARYARDLHDGFGQMISVLNMNLKNLEDGANPDERHKVFENSSKVIDEMYGELKNICFDLMPQTLIKHGLESALNEFAGRINQTEKIFIELNIFGLDQRLTEIQEISLYRISQEWVNNILKYSDADKITLQITKDESEITLLIEDNGAGFDKSLLEQGKGNGWKNLNTRSKLIQGELELETSPNQKGNVLIVNCPVEVLSIHPLFAKTN
jgi:signal transduction histidine kinase